MIPAPHAERRRIAERLRRLQVIELRRRHDTDERRQQHDIGVPLAEERVDAAAPWNRPLARAQDGTRQAAADGRMRGARSEEHTSELQSLAYLVCRLLLEKKKKKITYAYLMCTQLCLHDV